MPSTYSAWEMLAIDIVGPFTEDPVHCQFAIAFIDYYSKWPEIEFISNITSAIVITFLSSLQQGM